MILQVIYKLPCYSDSEFMNFVQTWKSTRKFMRSVRRTLLQVFFSELDPKNLGEPKVVSMKVLRKVRFSLDGHILDRNKEFSSKNALSV